MSLYAKLEADAEIKAPAEKFQNQFGKLETKGNNTDGKHTVSKELVETIDDENNSITLTVLEGDLLEHYKSFKATLTCIPKGNDEQGSIARWTLEYEKLHNEIVDPHTLIPFVKDVTKDIENHLITTP